MNNDFLYSAKKVEVIIEKDNIRKILIGTGFFIKKDKDLIFVTNRHMVEMGYKDPETKGYKIKSFKIEGFQNVKQIPNSLKSSEIANFNDFKFSSNSDDDVACLFEPRLLNGEANVDTWISYELLADNDFINNKVTICDIIAYPGFSNFYNKIINSPIIRTGTIASDPRYDYSGTFGITSSNLIAYEGYSFGGSSGSPVFLLEKGFELKGLECNNPNFHVEFKLIGINAGHYLENILVFDENHNNIESINAMQHAGISYFYKSSVIKEIIDSEIK